MENELEFYPLTGKATCNCRQPATCWYITDSKARVFKCEDCKNRTIDNRIMSRVLADKERKEANNKKCSVWRKKHPTQYRNYMREYMRKRRATEKAKTDKLSVLRSEATEAKSPCKPSNSSPSPDTPELADLVLIPRS